jgi:PAS domain S-box-containing protein
VRSPKGCPTATAALTHAAILGQLAEGVIVTNAEGRITLVNPAAAAIHGVSRLDVGPSGYSDTYRLFTEAGEPYPPLDLPLARAVRGEVVIGARWRIRRADGVEILAIGNAQPLWDGDGKQIGAVLTLRDETARDTAERALHELNQDLAQLVAHRTAEAERAKVQAERAQIEAERASAAKSDFLASMSHEIRTPLNGVVALADMLAHAGLPERERAMAQMICASADSLQRLLSDLLDMSRIESGKIVLEPAPFHVGDMLRAVAGLSQLECDEKGVSLRVAISPQIDETVVGDVVRLRQIITNLLSNAVKFTSEGEVALIAERLPHGRARFTVSDTGVGFSMAEKDKVFERFGQANNSITRRFGGTGLGLSICWNLALLMDGKLDCESEVGQGARFWIELPLPPSAPLPTSEPVQAADNEQTRMLRILLADDHPTNRRVVELMLDNGRAEITCTENGAEAVRAFEAGVFDLILMDMQMPVMDGLTALRRIRGIERLRKLARTPAIMLTANAMPEHTAAAAAAGADLHLTKPFTMAALFRRYRLEQLDRRGWRAQSAGVRRCARRVSSHHGLDRSARRLARPGSGGCATDHPRHARREARGVDGKFAIGDARLVQKKMGRVLTQGEVAFAERAQLGDQRV